MSSPDPDHVSVLRSQLHTVECLPDAAPSTRWSSAHDRRDEKKAEKLLTGLRNAGYTLTTLKEDR